MNMNMKKDTEARDQSRFRSVYVLVPIIGMMYFVLFSAFLISRSIATSGALPQYLIFFSVFSIGYCISSAAVWFKPRAGYIGAAAISAILILIFFLTRDGNDVINVLSHPNANVTQFVLYITAVPAFFAVLICSVVGFLAICRRLS